MEQTRYKKNGMSATPCSCPRNPFIFEFRDSADAFAAPVLLWILLVVLAIAGTFPCLTLFVLRKSHRFLLVSGNGKAFELQTHRLKAFTESLDDVEAIDDDGSIGEALLGYAAHGVTEVHRYFFHLRKIPGRYLLDDIRYSAGFGAFDDGNDRAFTAMAVLVGEYRVHFST